MEEENTNCGKCQKRVTNRQQALMCDDCSKWYHRICMKGTPSYLTQTRYRDIIKSQAAFEWICDGCDQYPGVINTVSPSYTFCSSLSNKRRAGME